MGYLIDTSLFVCWERRKTAPELPKHALETEVFLSAMTLSELLHGVHRADTAQRRQTRQLRVDQVARTFSVLAFDKDVAITHAALWADMVKNGELIGSHDLIIAATAIHHGHVVVSQNERDFGRVPGLQHESWAFNAA